MLLLVAEASSLLASDCETIMFLGTLWSSGLPASTSAAVHSKLMVITEPDFIDFKFSKFIRGEASEYVC